eukprot:scaffold8888_cov115-Isochrysis_galbana.AAC.4
MPPSCPALAADDAAMAVGNMSGAPQRLIGWAIDGNEYLLQRFATLAVVLGRRHLGARRTPSFTLTPNYSQTVEAPPFRVARAGHDLGCHAEGGRQGQKGSKERRHVHCAR